MSPLRLLSHRLSNEWRDLKLGFRNVAAEVAKSALGRRFKKRKSDLLSAALATHAGAPAAKRSRQ